MYGYGQAPSVDAIKHGFLPQAVELELDTYAAIIAEMGHVANSMATSGHPEGEALVERHAQLSESLARLQRRAALRQAALVESVCR